MPHQPGVIEVQPLLDSNQVRDLRRITQARALPDRHTWRVRLIRGQDLLERQRRRVTVCWLPDPRRAVLAPQCDTLSGENILPASSSLERSPRASGKEEALSEITLRAFHHRPVGHDARVALRAREIADLDHPFLPYHVALVGQGAFRGKPYAAARVKLGKPRW